MGQSIFPTGVTNFKPSKTWSGYTLFNAKNEGTILIDMNGKIVHEWKDLQGFPNKMIKGGQVFGSLRCRKSSDAYQDYADLTEIDWDGNIRWSFTHNEEVIDQGIGKTWVARVHHDYQLDGNPVGYFVPGQETKDDFKQVLLLTHHDRKIGSISPYPLLDHVLLEIDRNGNKLWSWSTLDHFNDFPLTDEQKNAIFKNPNFQSASKEGDVFHINYASYLGPNKWFDQGDQRFKPNNILMGSREAMMSWIVDHDTGKIVWLLGPDFTKSFTLRNLGPLVGMHNVHLIPKGLPGAGNILALNNGGWAGYGAPNQTSSTGMRTTRIDGSEVIEFNPITLEKKWSFSAKDMGYKAAAHANYFYSPLEGSVQRLPNGNTLIDEGAGGRFLEVTPSHEIVWEYIYPYIADHLIYRAYRIPYDWIPQLSPSTEIAVTPPANSEFHLPGAADPSLNPNTTVSVTGAYGYNKPSPAKNNNQIFSILT